MTSIHRVLCAVVVSLVTLSIIGCSGDQPRTEQLLSQADTFYSAERYDEAEQAYLGILRLDRTNLTALRRLGVIYHEQGQLQQAYPLLKQAAERAPDDF